mmetsp:Transcript_31086/g.85118  ORF Transcript_31086/g.85118 Transcript_31086/m.85118 type:complete len:119 (+) Transcript_31086:1200-1556(+)
MRGPQTPVKARSLARVRRRTPSSLKQRPRSLLCAHPSPMPVPALALAAPSRRPPAVTGASGLGLSPNASETPEAPPAEALQQTLRFGGATWEVGIGMALDADTEKRIPKWSRITQIGT